MKPAIAYLSFDDSSIVGVVLQTLFCFNQPLHSDMGFLDGLGYGLDREFDKLRIKIMVALLHVSSHEKGF